MLFAFGMIATTNAQSVYTMKTTLTGSKAVDTTDNTETNYLVFATTQTQTASIQVIGTKLGGAPNGCFTLEFSNDGTNWTTVSAADTIHMNNSATVTQGFFTKTTWPYQYVRVKSVGRGTASYKFIAYLKPLR